MSEKPLDLIEKYLDRVRVYLPIDSEDVLIEIRTHLIEEAESIGDGSITRGSTMMAIERFGDPKEAANAAAGTGKKVGPVPTEYTQPLIRMIVVIVALSTAFLVGASVIGLTFPDWFDITNYPIALPFIFIQGIIYLFIIIGVLYLVRRESAPTEKTPLEEVLGIGSGAFKPKPRTDAFADMFFGMIFGIVLLLPQMQITYTLAFAPFVNIIVVLMFVGALKGLLFFVYGENNVNLMFEIFLSAAWVILCIGLINVGWGLDSVWSFSDTTGWTLTSIAELGELIPFFGGMFDALWAFIIFIITAVSIWQIIMSTMKVSMYTKAEKGWWWTGNFGKSRPFGRRHFGRIRQ
ncbi:MAG: hypothetical protein ACTSUO_00305 [Candidatus Thorarchaeota archaeon]